MNAAINPLLQELGPLDLIGIETNGVAIDRDSVKLRFLLYIRVALVNQVNAK